jgi:branched-chain amino acid transport system permease protein
MVSLELAVQTAVNGLLLGGIYAVAALGLTLVFGIMDIVNLAHGHMLMVGSYVAIILFATLGLSPLIGMLAAMVVLFVLGVVLQRLVLNRVVGEGLEQPILVLFGVALVLQNLGQYFLGSNAQSTDLGILQGGLNIGPILGVGPIFLSSPRTITFVVAVALVALTWLFLHRTTTGTAIRATSQNTEAAQYMGIDTDRVYVLTLGIGAALAGAGGALLSMLFPITPFVGWSYLLTTFAVVVLGGVGSIVGTLVGGLVLGVSENLGALYLGGGFRNIITFTIFLAVLLVRPRGLFGSGGSG